MKNLDMLEGRVLRKIKIILCTVFVLTFAWGHYYFMEQDFGETYRAIRVVNGGIQKLMGRHLDVVEGISKREKDKEFRIQQLEKKVIFLENLFTISIKGENEPTRDIY